MDKLKIIEHIVTEYQDQLFRFAFFRVGSEAQAQDIVQDCFIKLMNERYDLSAVKNLRAYLFRAVANGCNDYLRKKNRDIRVPIESVPAEVCEEEEDVREEYERINTLMSELPDEQVEVIKMRTVNGLSFVEIADILGIPVTTVKSRFKYGIDKLRAKIN